MHDLTERTQRPSFARSILFYPLVCRFASLRLKYKIKTRTFILFFQLNYCRCRENLYYPLCQPNICSGRNIQVEKITEIGFEQTFITFFFYTFCSTTSLDREQIYDFDQLNKLRFYFFYSVSSTYIERMIIVGMSKVLSISFIMNKMHINIALQSL